MPKPTPATDTLPDMPFLRRDKHGDVLVDVHVMPNASRTGIDGLHGEAGNVALKIRLKAPPVDGKANDELVKWLAAQLGIPRHAIDVARGKTSRKKQLKVTATVAEKADWQRLEPAESPDAMRDKLSNQ